MHLSGAAAKCLSVFQVIQVARVERLFLECVTQAASRVLAAAPSGHCLFRAVDVEHLSEAERATPWFAGACRVGLLLGLRCLPQSERLVVASRLCGKDDTPRVPGLNLDDTFTDGDREVWQADELELLYGGNSEIVLFCDLLHTALEQVVNHSLSPRPGLPPPPSVTARRVEQVLCHYPPWEQREFRRFAARQALRLLEPSRAEEFRSQQRGALKKACLSTSELSETTICYSPGEKAFVVQPLGVSHGLERTRASQAYRGLADVWADLVAHWRLGGEVVDVIGCGLSE